MKFIKTIPALITLILISTAHAQTTLPAIQPAEPSQVIPTKPALFESQPDPANKPIHDALEKTLVNVSDAPLHVVLTDIAARAKVPIYIDWYNLELAGVTRNQMVRIPLNQVSADQALRTVLRHTSPAVDLAFLVDKGIVRVAPRDDLRREFAAIHTYDISGLTADFEPESPQAREIEDTLLSAIITTIGEDTWRENGGIFGTARISNRKLIVRQSYDILPAVDQLVAQILSSPRTSTRAYDVHDLLKDAPPPDPANPFAPTKIHELIHAIQTSCGRETWKEHPAGTTRTSTIAHFNNKLLITTTPAVHHQIETLLHSLRTTP